MNQARPDTSGTLQCHKCAVAMQFTPGTEYVQVGGSRDVTQCYSCGCMNRAVADSDVGGKVLSMLCPVCCTTNLSPYGVVFVRCGVCGTVSKVDHAYRAQV
ncbi:MAG: hypothetical protein KVP17_000817 [Porospora cf. gigantea B]|uniref:uncharacterized protein n=1 Tax=Porospora cf. gigantea B TaxID=2853592 RepID=UPI003571E160|nr:MAG: hypothetical protein KVP17_000817 [Porospora cf. gigantea B]